MDIPDDVIELLLARSPKVTVLEMRTEGNGFRVTTKPGEADRFALAVRQVINPDAGHLIEVLDDHTVFLRLGVH